MDIDNALALASMGPKEIVAALQGTDLSVREAVLLGHIECLLHDLDEAHAEIEELCGGDNP